jgi:two-component system response regulator DesR
VARIIIVDDERLVRESMLALLSREESIDVIATVASGAEAIDISAAFLPDVVLSGLQMSGMNGIDLAVELMRKYSIPTVLVTSQARPGLVDAAIASGVRGMLTRDASTAKLVDTILKVAGGDSCIDPDLVFEAMLVGSNPLTCREKEILNLSRHGAPMEEVALQSKTSSATVRNHLHAAKRKLNARNHMEAVSIARTRGWI